MRHVIPTILIAACLLAACSHDKGGLPATLVTNPKSAVQPSDKQAVIAFDKVEHHFGKLLQGEKVTCSFHFTNTGTAPLIITKVVTSCGCTAGDFPRDPIAPGKGGVVKATYDSKGHNGFQRRTLVVSSNTNPSNTTLTIKAEVAPPDQF